MAVTQPKDPKRSDGKAVQVTAVSSFDKGTLVRKHRGITTDWYGFACEDAVSGDNVELTIAPYEFEFIVPSGVTGAFGDILYFDPSNGDIIDGAIDDGDVPFAKVTVAKDSNDVVWAILLPQLVEW